MDFRIDTLYQHVVVGTSLDAWVGFSPRAIGLIHHIRPLLHLAIEAARLKFEITARVEAG